jgi:spore maturation protein CgeB
MTQAPSLRIVILGLSITSSWGNGHATTYRGLLRELTARGHDVLFLERDVEWYAANRDLLDAGGGRIALYADLADLRRRFGLAVAEADLVIVGSFVPQGTEVGQWVIRTARGLTAFYDIDTPVTLAKLSRGEEEYISARLIPEFQLYLSFTGGPTLERLELEYGAPVARALYCSVDPTLYYPEITQTHWDLGYMGTYSRDRQTTLTLFLLEPARCWAHGRFVVAGPQYPSTVSWPGNVTRIDHLAPTQHRGFYNAQRFTLNLTRADMVSAGFSPSVRLFEAAACGTPIISDRWDGIESLFQPGEEILIAGSSREVIDWVRELPEPERLALGDRSRARVLAHHTAAHRAAELEAHALELLSGQPSS